MARVLPKKIFVSSFAFFVPSWSLLARIKREA